MDEEVGQCGGGLPGSRDAVHRRATALGTTQLNMLVLICVAMVATTALVGCGAEGHDHGVSSGGRVSGSAGAEERPTFWERVGRTLLLSDYNTRVVVLGTAPLGIAAGVVGAFLLLRKRSLLTDALSHATLPGIAGAFLLMASLGGDAKWLPGLLLGALVTGLMGMGCVSVIRHFTRLKDDAALGIVLSVFFGAGIALLGVIQGMDGVNSAGIKTFIYGKTAALALDYAIMMGTVVGVVTVACVVFFKELAIVCFDDDFAGAQGWPVGLIDLVLMTLVVAVTVIGLHAVGLILIIALLIIPPAAARFWTDRLGMLVVGSALIGMASTYVGAAVSAVLPKMPAGAIIVLAGAGMFLISLVFGRQRGLIVRWRRYLRLRGRVGRQHLLRGIFEELESRGLQKPADMTGATVAIDDLMPRRSWSRQRLMSLLHRARRAGLVESHGRGRWALTPEGAAVAGRVVRNHRLWEIYLIEHAAIAPSHVDRDADAIEHVIGTQLTRELETLLARRHPQLAVPPSPHTLSGRAAEQGDGR